MAASVLLGSAESTGPGFCAPGSVLAGNNGGSAPASSWNRSLDRALDEASATGALNLSGRKLKEFPRSAANHDLTDTTRAGESEPGFGRGDGPGQPRPGSQKSWAGGTSSRSRCLTGGLVRSLGGMPPGPTWDLNN